MQPHQHFAAVADGNSPVASGDDITAGFRAFFSVVDEAIFKLQKIALTHFFASTA